MLRVVRNNENSGAVKENSQNGWTKRILETTREIIEQRKSALIELGKS